jgi:hypothetical protein
VALDIGPVTAGRAADRQQATALIMHKWGDPPQFQARLG